MEEQVWQHLIDYLEKVENFTSEQLPDLIFQILTYEKIMAITSIVVATLVIFMLARIGYTYWKDPKRDSFGCRTGEAFIGIWVSCSLSFILIGLLCSSVTSLIKLYVAPKFYLLQFFVNMKS